MKSGRFRVTFVIGFTLCVLITLVLVSGCIGTSKTATNKSSGTTPQRTYAAAVSPVPTTIAENWYDEHNKWSQITVLLNSTTKIQLNEDPQTGKWRVDLTDGLRIENEGFVPYNSTANSEVVGGVHVWYVHAIARGAQKFSATYIYNGDKPAGEKKIFELGFNVV